MAAAGPAADTIYSNLYKIPFLLGADLGYNYQGKLLRHSAELRGGLGWLLSPYKPAGEIFGYTYAPQVDLPFDLMLNYSLAFTLWQNQSLRLGLGPGLYFSLDAWLGTDPDVLRYTWLTSTGIGLKLFLAFHSKVAEGQTRPRHRLFFSLYLPVLSIGWRPQYQVYTLREETLLETKGMLAAMFDSPQFLSLHNTLDLTAEVSWQYRLLPALDLLLKYQWHFVYTASTRARLELQNHVILGVSFHF